MAPFASLCAAATALLLATSVAADMVLPSNATFTRQPNSIQPVLALYAPDNSPPQGFALIDLHDKGASELTTNGGSTDLGSLLLVGPPSFPQPDMKSVAYISCDPEDYPGNELVDDVYSQTSSSPQVLAIVFYSRHSNICRLNNVTESFLHLYSMTSTNDSMTILMDINGTTPGYTARVATQQSFNQDAGGSPTASTAVAMIILYSITGLITGLFVLIIISGAIRAHRHPERYGPRNIVGRTRQSRAKGMARAMLDTIPIVKFGEQEPAADKAGDLELGSPTRQTPEPPTTASENAEMNARLAQSEHSETNEHDSSTADGPGAAIAGVSKESGGENIDEGLGCSICTEDFEKGQDIRVLPCNHKFHPTCVDPWLLDVSGTCPLCRVDLRPPEAEDENQETLEGGVHTNGQNSGNTRLPPPLDPNAASSPASRRRLNAFRSMFHWRRMEELTQEERMEALRQFREQEETRRARRAERQTSNAATSDPSGDDAEQDDRTRWARLRGRITRLR